MRKFGLIGYPLGHSFSGKYFAEKFHRANPFTIVFIQILKLPRLQNCRRF